LKIQDENVIITEFDDAASIVTGFLFLCGFSHVCFTEFDGLIHALENFR
jgi:hypothetical protein